MIQRFGNIVLGFLVATAIHGQNSNGHLFSVYRTKDGLSNNYVNAITQDAFGYIWIGTKKGLNRFDGLNFRHFYSDSLINSLPEDRVFDLKWINDRELGVLTNTGLHIINTVNLEMRNLVIPADSAGRLPVVNQIFDIEADKNENLFLSTIGGFYHFNKKKELVFRYDSKSPRFGLDIISVNENTLLVSTHEGLYIYNIKGKDLHALSAEDDPFFHLIAHPKQRLRLIYAAKDFIGVSYIGKTEYALFDIVHKNKQIITPPASISSNSGVINEFYHVNDSTIAVACEGIGIYMLHLNHQTRSWAADSLAYFKNDFCTALMVDRNGRTWIGATNGLYKLNKTGARVKQAQLPGGEFSIGRTITGLAGNNNSVLAGTLTDGLYIFDRDSLSFSRHITDPKNLITQLLPVNQDTIISAGKGFLINTQTLQHSRFATPDARPNSFVRTVFKDSQNSIYFTYNNSDTLYFKPYGDKLFEAIHLPGLGNIEPLQGMTEDNAHNIWIAGRGLIRFNRNLKKIDFRLDSFPYIKTGRKEIGSNMVFDSNNRIYFGVPENGLVIYDIQNKTSSLLTRFDGLPDNTVRSLYLHNNKTLWIATEGGLANYDLNEKRLASFGVSDGMPAEINTCNVLYYDDRDHILYAGCSPFVIGFDPLVLRKNQLPPLFFIESIDVTETKSLYHPANIVTVPYSNNSVIVNMAAINFEDAGQQQFAYRIVKNGEEKWRELGTQRRIFFNDLPVGKYKVQVKVYIRNQSWPDQVKEFTLVVQPPFWKTIWFYLAIICLAALLLYYLYRQRIKQITHKVNLDKLMAQTEMKALHSQMNPHFIFNCLNSIREMILNNETKQASHYLNKFAQLIRITLNQSLKSFVSLNDTIDYLQRYLEMEKIRATNFTHSIRVDETLTQSDILLPPMLIQPFIENAIWHGVASLDQPMKIDIRFEKEHEQLLCVIEDDGIGIETSLSQKETQLGHQSVGIENIKQRIKVLNEKYNLKSTVTIEDKSSLSSANGTGTIVKLRLPLKGTTIL